MLTLDRPRDSDTHTAADFAELLCLIQPDRVLSQADLADHIRGAGASGDVKELIDEPKREQSIRDEEQLDDTFAHLVWRAGAFGDGYPFSIVSGDNVLRAPEQLSDAQKRYVFFLVCANLPLVPHTERLALTRAFEKACLLVLLRLWPEGGVVRMFARNDMDYAGSKVERLNTLARDTGARPAATAEHFRRRDSGDGGIDLVGWKDLDRFEKRNIPSVLAQCACSRDDWSGKQAEIGDILEGILNPTCRWTRMVFIPISFRGGNGQWAYYAQVSQVVLVDRLRLLNHLEAADPIELPTYIDTVLGQRAALV